MMLLLQMTMKNVIEPAGDVEITMIVMGDGGSCHYFLMLLGLVDARSYSRKRC